MNEIPEFQYAGLGRLVVQMLREHKGDWPVVLEVDLLDFRRTVNIICGDKQGEITLRFPVVPL